MKRPTEITDEERQQLYFELGRLTAQAAASPWTRCLDGLPEGIKGGALCGKEWTE